MSKVKEETKRATIEGINRIAQEIGFSGSNWPRFAKALNSANPPVLSVAGKPWSLASSAYSLRKFCSENSLVFPVEQENPGALHVQDTECDVQSPPAEPQGDPDDESEEPTVCDAANQDENQACPSLEPPSVTQRNTEHIDSVTLDRLMTMLDWFESRKDELTGIVQAPPMEVRPNFKRGSDTKTVTFRFGKELYDQAQAEAKRQKALTGGTLNGFVEILLWKALGSPSDLLNDEG
jgi:hypothetical protein